jgi:hypothetical protein
MMLATSLFRFAGNPLPRVAASDSRTGTDSGEEDRTKPADAFFSCQTPLLDGRYDGVKRSKPSASRCDVANVWNKRVVVQPGLRAYASCGPSAARGG